MYEIIAAKANAQSKATIHTLTVLGSILRFQSPLSNDRYRPISAYQYNCTRGIEIRWYIIDTIFGVALN
jgi:hypothetical protein